MEYAFYNFQCLNQQQPQLFLRPLGNSALILHNEFNFVLTGMRPLDLKVATLLRSSSRQS